MATTQPKIEELVSVPVRGFFILSGAGTYLYFFHVWVSVPVRGFFILSAALQKAGIHTLGEFLFPVGAFFYC